MIRSFANTHIDTERVWDGLSSRKLPREVQQRALAKLRLLNAATALNDLRNPPATVSTRSLKTASVSTQFPLTTNIVYASPGRTETHTMSRSSTITDPDWLENVHAGGLLLSEFMEPLDLSTAELARSVNVDAARIEAVVRGSLPMDAELDLRLTRYFRMSEGFFLRLQNDYETLEAKRALNGELERILPRAA